jgi:citrate lyase subunit beta/citryl-CoA lyase
MVKSLQLQAEMMQEFGACVFDVTLDCEDGAPVGGEVDQANMVAALAQSAQAATNSVANSPSPRIGVRLHTVDHAAFASDVEIIVGSAASALSYIMIPKVESVAEVELAVSVIDAACKTAGRVSAMPLHVLIESPAAVHHAFAIAAHPRVQSLSFGLMDFVSSHAGAIPSSAMAVRGIHDGLTLDQFHHPLVVRAKAEIASACHANGKVLLGQAATMAANALGFTRMWSIHPDQIRPILKAFSPPMEEVELAAHIVVAAQAQDWAPISVDGKLHDRASYRYFWQVLERAHQTGCAMPAAAQAFFITPLPQLQGLVGMQTAIN